MSGNFELLLFSTDPEYIVPAAAAGIDAILVDWENIGKRERQKSADTQINLDTVADLKRVRACTEARVICRINSFGAITAREVEEAAGAGADEILLPMVRTEAEVEEVLGLVEGRCRLGILIETLEAVELAERLGRLPLSRIYVGLNDLSIQRGTPNIFTAVADGVVERVRRAVGRPFGFAGLTSPGKGYPIPCRLLIGEMARLRCDFSFLRRSFLADVAREDLDREVAAIRRALAEAGARDAERVEHERLELLEAIRSGAGPLVRRPVE